jgi:galactokinase
MQMLVQSTVPPAGGLSSRSSLVIAVSIAILEACGGRLTQSEIAEFTAMGRMLHVLQLLFHGTVPTGHSESSLLRKAPHWLCVLQLLVHGTVPPAGGLSSSSSFVVAVSIAILAAYGCRLLQSEIAEFTAVCERHIGVASGGMDQAISVMARLGVLTLVALQTSAPKRCKILDNSLAKYWTAWIIVLRQGLRIHEFHSTCVSTFHPRVQFFHVGTSG